MDDWSKAEHHAERAHRYYQSGQWEKALTEIRAALAVNPHQSEWHFGMGLTLDALHRYDEAILAFEEALKLNADDADTILHLSVDLIRAQRPDRAIDLLNQLSRNDPKCEPAYCYRIAAYAQKGEHDQAEVMFYLARQLNDDCPVCYDHLAQSLAARGQYDRAAWCWQKAKRIEPNFPGIHANLARLHWRQGRLDDARQSYLRELREDPGDTQTLLELAHVLIDLGHAAEAGEKLRRILELDPEHAPAHLLLAELSFAAGHLDAAQASLERAMAHDAELPGLHLRLAQVALGRGREDLAWRQARQELARPQHSPSHALELSRLLIELKKPKPAEKLLRAQIARGEEAHYSTDLRAALQMYLGVTRMLAGRIDAGIADCRLALRLDPDNAMALHNLTLAYVHLRRLKRARACLRQALKLQPQDPELKRLRTRIQWLRWLGPLVRLRDRFRPRRLVARPVQTHQKKKP